ncbi:NADH dehydrogenase [Endomicrobiia bacterium]|nr:NADH dehydrogenase [Endomicrobiia bacterium]GHT65569.1 NADH dehydrogenase [Endomicrobiia bacterium]GHT70887.1 NADH dehydrogenase [Endomicrobiia bacterium]GHT75144.1 NADH dehydrogenase [Endomicrobiia bacterium]
MGSNYDKFETVCRILEENKFDKAKLISILQTIQEEYKYLPEEILAFVASTLKISPAKVYGVATFFAHFTLEPKGKHIIRICDGTACHVKRSTSLIETVRNKLGLKENEISTKDMLFTIDTVACLGACGLAPVVVVNEEVHGQMTPDKIVSLVDEILKQEEVK